MMSKIQNLNGTHNIQTKFFILNFVVYDVKDTKFEWNSQHIIFLISCSSSCLWCQRYKIWMELTTASNLVIYLTMLFMMSKIQNLNGTHNVFAWVDVCCKVVYDVKDTKFEWNSQLNWLQSNYCPGCLWCQRYKIWMELTTSLYNSFLCYTLFMMSKIQNLNGTHNKHTASGGTNNVVYDVKDTKFEWNSQQVISAIAIATSCLWCQRYKIWMELTTKSLYTLRLWRLFMMSKIQNLNGTHNQNLFLYLPYFVVYDVKDTKFEWNSQHIVFQSSIL